MENDLKNDDESPGREIYSAVIPAGIVELKYTGPEECLIENANSFFYETANCIDEDFFKTYGYNYRKIILDEDWGVFKEKIKEALKGNGLFCCEYRVRGKTGELYWRKINASIIKTNDKNDIRFLGVLSDITDLKAVQKELEKERESFYTIASLASAYLFEYEIDTDTIYDITGGKINKYLSDYSNKIYDRSNPTFFEIEDCAEFIKKLRSGEKEIYFESKVNVPNKNEEWIALWGKTIYDKKGKPLKVIGKSQNIDELKKKESIIENRANFDNLTGLYNGNYARTLINERIKKQTSENYAIIVVDFDNFEKLNNNLGHIFCDEVLLNISKGICEIFDPDDIIGRIGGDEFIIFTEKALSKDWLITKLAKIKNVFKETYSGEDSLNRITGSIGAAMASKNEDFEKLFEKADYSLYISKSIGKNEFHIFSPEDVQPFENKIKKFESNIEEKFVYKKEINEERAFNYEISEFAFDIMESTKDVDSAVNILLNKVGNYFNLSRIVIRELHASLEKTNITYQWHDKSVLPIVEERLISSYEEIEKLFSKYDSNGIFIYSEYPGFEQNIAFAEAIDADVKSTLRFAIMESGNFRGSISFDDCHVRVWGHEEVKSLKMIGKIISAYLLKMRAFKEAQATVEKLTKYDSVTGVMKYDKFKEEVARVLKGDPTGIYAVVYSDISNFKFINERYGYEEGDQILKNFASDIGKRKYNLVVTSRIFSDNFISLIKLDNSITSANIGEVIDDYNSKFISAQRKKYDEINFHITSGVYVMMNREEFSNKIEAVNKIIDNANIARRYAKNVFSEKCIFFDSEMEKTIKKQAEILTSMEKALTNNEFNIVLQPKVELKGNNKIVGAEALVRWIKKDGRIIPPMDFIPIFEKNGFVVNVDFCVYEQVCKFLSRRIIEGKRVVPISVNVSRVHLEKDNFIEKIVNLVTKYRIPRELLEFELTENVFLQNSDKAIYIMNTLKNIGFKVSMDDFGSGYSSLNLLKKLPVDVLKMDKGFLDNDEIKGNDEVVITSVIDMAKKMKITVLCEGVETEKQANFLRDAGCDLAQGYYFSKPVKIDEFKEMISKR